MTSSFLSQEYVALALIKEKFYATRISCNCM